MATQLNNSVSKAFSILKLFSKGHSEIRAADVVRALGMNGITAHRFLKTLEHEGALVQTGKGQYRLGYMLVELGDLALREEELGRILQPVLNAMTADLNEATMATIYHDGMVMCIARATPSRALSVDIRVGSRLEAYCTAHGKVWLAHLPERELESYFDKLDLARMTSRTITSKDALRMELDRVARESHAFNEGEREEGITAVAVPVLTGTGRMIAGLSVFGPTSRFTAELRARALVRLHQACGHAQALLYGAEKGGTSPHRSAWVAAEADRKPVRVR
ncbi:MAG: IclR family transcriptional regulator [Rhizobiaceae bacterium]|nr:IclR family transcriptional regulator [Rhizobiaceae bacterium]